MRNTITSLQAFKALQNFLDNYYYTTPSETLDLLLSYIQLLQDGKTADPAFWADWLIITDNKTHLTTLEAYAAMYQLIKEYADRISSADLKTLLSYMQLSSDNKTHDPAMWDKWIACVDGILKDDETLKALNKRITLNKSSSCYD